MKRRNRKQGQYGFCSTVLKSMDKSGKCSDTQGDQRKWYSQCTFLQVLPTPMVVLIVPLKRVCPIIRWPRVASQRCMRHFSVLRKSRGPTYRRLYLMTGKGSTTDVAISIPPAIIFFLLLALASRATLRRMHGSKTPHCAREPTSAHGPAPFPQRYRCFHTSLPLSIFFCIQPTSWSASSQISSLKKVGVS